MEKEQPKVWAKYLWQLYALLYKNAVLFKRDYFSSLVHLLAPAVCVLFFGLALHLDGVQTIDRDPQAFTTLGGDGTSLLGSCTVFDRAGGRFGLGRPMKNVDCVTLVYAPMSPITNRIMEEIAARNGQLEMGKDIIGFQNESSMVEFFAQETPTPVFAGLLFDATGNIVSSTSSQQSLFTGFGDEVKTSAGMEDVSLISYEVWYNKTVLSGAFLGTGGKDMLSFETDARHDGYVLQVQRAVNEALLSLHSGQQEAVLEMAIKPFPVLKGVNTNAASDDGPGSVSIESLGALFYIIGIMVSFITILRQVVQEKDDKILDALRMMGLYESCYWLSWVVHFGLLLIFTTLLMIAAGKLVSIPLFLYSSFGWLFFVLYFYLFAMACFAMGVSAFLPNTKTAMMLGFLMLTVAVIFQLIVSTGALPIITIVYNPNKLSEPLRNLINLYPPLLYTKMDQNMFTMTQVRQVTVDGTVKEVHGEYLWEDASDGAYQFVDLSAIQFGENGINRTIDYQRYCETGQGRGCYDHQASCSANDYKCDTSGCYSPSCSRVVCSSDWKPRVSQQECEAAPGGVFSSQPPSFFNPVGVSNCACTFSIPSDTESLGRMIGASIFWLVIAWYFGQVITFGHGRAEPLWFPFTPWYWLGSFGVKNPFAGSGKQPTSDGNKDDDVQQEEQAIRSGERSDEDRYPVVIQNLVKDFGGLFSKRFRAVNGITLALEKGNCFALLGHNGAGKTTAINMLSGMIAPSGGDSMIYGKSVRDSISSIRHEIGVCPQHDILWAQLTAREHLRFYGHFQGMNLRQVREQGEYLLKQVHLDGLKRVAGNYSGGMRRRLSMTIAALGNKRIIFLDEPTTGLDPQNQRHVWDMINELKEGRVVILTTHLMDEADMLGDRIGIMSRGRLVALGNPLHLKAKFGGNYKISINPMDGDASRQAIDKEVRRLVPNVNLDESSGVGSGPMVYSIPPSSFNAAPDLFRWIDAGGSSLVKDWGLSQTSLEDVFVSLDEGNHQVPSDPRTLAVKTENNTAMAQELYVGETDAEAVEEFQTEYRFERSFRGQVRGLFLKSATLQKRQRITVCCQVGIPLLLVVGLYLLTKLIESELSSDKFDLAFISCYGCLAEEIRRAKALIENGQECKNCAVGGFNQTSLPAEYLALYEELKTLPDEFYTSLEKMQGAYQSDFQPGWFNTTTNPFYGFCASDLAEPSLSCEQYARQTSNDLIVEPSTWFSPFVQPVAPEELKEDKVSGDGQEINANERELFASTIAPRFWVALSSNSAALKAAVGERCTSAEQELRLEELEALTTCEPRGVLERLFGLENLDSQQLNCWLQVGNESAWTSEFVAELKSGGPGLLDAYPVRLGWSREGRNAAGQVVANSTVNIGPSFCLVEDAGSFSSLADDIRSASDQSVAINEILLRAQEDYKNKVGPFASKIPKSAQGMRQLRKMFDDYFPSAGLVFSELDASQGRLRFVYQGFFQPVEGCTTSGYDFAAVEIELENPDTSSVCNPNAVFAGRDLLPLYLSGTSFVRRQVVGNINRVLNGVTSAMLSKSGSAGSPFKDVARPVVTTGVRAIPYRVERTGNEDIIKIVSGIIGGLFLPLATVFLLPVLVFHLVHEKEHKLRSSLLMMGMQMRVYWFVQYLFDVVLSCVVLVAIYILCMILSVDVFARHQFGIVLLLLFLWANAQTALAFLLSVFFNKTRNANIAMYLLILAATIGAFILNIITFAEKPFLPAPGWYMWFPLFTYCRAIYLLSNRSYYWEDLDTSDEMVATWGILILQTFVMFLLTFYLDQVLPKEFGVRRSPLFFLDDLKKWILRRPCGASPIGPQKHASPSAEDVDDEDDEIFNLRDLENSAESDPDVNAELAYVLQGNANDAPIRIINLKKRFGNFQAVDGVTMHMKDKSLTSLLGPNGAGKSTTISMLTGLYGPSSGEAFVDQKSIATEMQLVHNVIGVCPQHDITWPELTIKEHLLLYARLKGAPRSKEADLVKNAIAAVKLTGHEHKRARQLSGGQRRRLSIAISFIGNPRVVFLDEPTTGVDPVTRSQVHDLVLREKNKRCIVLTTHLMSESEKLSDRIAIMAHGKLKTIGTANRLKQKYNEGFKLILVVSDAARAEKFVTSRLPGAVLESKVNAKVTYQIDAASDLRLADVWELMQEGIKDNGISDWQISATTLEDVFIQIASESEATYGTA